MLRRLAHRGPDGGGSYVAQDVSLGSRRLAALDLSTGGNQPLCNEDRTLWGVLDGAIYNHRELRRRLESRGHHFAGAGDAESALHAYEEWGTDCLRRLAGEFALALWDDRKKRLFLARDRLGVKPVYYAQRGDRLVFASEIKALLEWDGLVRDVDPQSLLDYLGFGFTPAPRTLFAGVTKLEAGHSLVWEDGGLTEQTYWDVPIYRGNTTRREAEDQLVSRLEEAVQLRLAADVPVGLLLSGGLDSTVILALAAYLGGELPATFALGHAEEGPLGDLARARRIARHFGTDHHEVVLERTAPEDLRETIWALDEPTGDPAAVPFYLLCRAARSRVKVVLCGEGGDELLAGYDRFRASRIESRVRLLPRVLRGALFERLAGGPSAEAGEGSLRGRVRRFAQGARLPREGRHMRWRYFFPPEAEGILREPERWGLAEHDRFAPVRRRWEASAHHHALSRESYVDLKLILADGTLVKTDKLSQAHGLEVRLPFLDTALVELVVPWPPRWKLEGSRTKAILRSAASRHRLLPSLAAGRGRRHGAFRRRWLTGLREFLADTFTSSRFLAELCTRPALDGLLRDHLDGRSERDPLVGELLALAVWHDLYIASPPPPAEPERGGSWLKAAYGEIT